MPAALDAQGSAARETQSQLEIEISLLKRAMCDLPREGEVATKVKLPKPKPFNGAKSAKDLENFLWDMKQYFKAARVPDQEMIMITSMYLSGDAKLWCRTYVEDYTNAGRVKIDSWEALKKELKDQFLPTNTVWVAKDSLKKLKHTGTMREYFKTFNSLMLDILNMSEKDKPFNFKSSLQPWAQLELKRQAVRDLPTTMSIADALVDYKYNKPSRDDEKCKSKEKGKDKQKKDGKKNKDKQKKNWGNKSKGESSTS